MQTPNLIRYNRANSTVRIQYTNLILIPNQRHSKAFVNGVRLLVRRFSFFFPFVLFVWILLYEFVHFQKIFNSFIKMQKFRFISSRWNVMFSFASHWLQFIPLSIFHRSIAYIYMLLGLSQSKPFNSVTRVCRIAFNSFIAYSFLL